MRTKAPSKKSLSQDRKRISRESHEIDYAASKLPTRGKRTQARKAAVLLAKHKLGRATGRKKVMAEATAIVNTKTNRSRSR